MSLPKYYIVNSHKDLMSGKIIPQKVLNNMPIGIGSPFVPVPITKSSELVVSPASPGLSWSPLSPLSPVFPTFSQPVFGPPIIKMSNIMSNNIPTQVHIIAPNMKWVLDIPYANIRQAWQYIVQNAQTNLPPNSQQITFKFYAPPMYDFQITTTQQKMQEIVTYLSNTYAGIKYYNQSGALSNAGQLLQSLGINPNAAPLLFGNRRVYSPMSPAFSPLSPGLFSPATGPINIWDI